MRTTPSGFQAEATCQGSSPEGATESTQRPDKGHTAPTRSAGLRAGPRRPTRQGGSVRSRQRCLCRPRRYSEQTSVRTAAGRQGPRACPHTARGLRRSPGKGGGGDPIQRSTLRLVHILERRACGGPLGQVASPQALAHLRGRQDNQNKRLGNAAEGGARASQRPQQRRASSSTGGLSLHRPPR